jgi:protein-disulfide isomerase
MRLFAAILAFIIPCLAAPPVDKGKALGNPNAPVTLEILSDFACPACRAFHEQTLPLLMRDFVMPGKVYIVSREFPLNLAEHKYSREAATLATAAARVGKYAAVSDALFQKADATFTKPDSWTVNGKVMETISVALSPEQRKKVQTLAKDPTVIAAVQADLNYAQASGVNQTPTVILTRGNKRIPMSGAALKYTLMKSMIDDLVNGK